MMNAMIRETRHLSVYIDRPVTEVYDYISNPANLAEWAAGLGRSLEKIDGQWVMDSPSGPTVIVFTPPNEFGVVDHHVTTAEGETVYVPMRVIADGDSSELVFSLRRLPGMTDDEFDRDSSAVSTDLALAKKILERE